MKPHPQPIIMQKTIPLQDSKFRRAALGLTLHGPFSLNRRRRREVQPALVVSTMLILLTLAAVIIETFYC